MLFPRFQLSSPQSAYVCALYVNVSAEWDGQKKCRKRRGEARRGVFRKSEGDSGLQGIVKLRVERVYRRSRLNDPLTLPFGIGSSSRQKFPGRSIRANLDGRRRVKGNSDGSRSKLSSDPIDVRATLLDFIDEPIIFLLMLLFFPPSSLFPFFPPPVVRERRVRVARNPEIIALSFLFDFRDRVVRRHWFWIMSNLFVIYGERGNSALPFRSRAFTVSLRRATRQPIFRLFLLRPPPFPPSLPFLRRFQRSDHVRHAGKSILGNNQMSALFSRTAWRCCRCHAAPAAAPTYRLKCGHPATSCFIKSPVHRRDLDTVLQN